MVQCPICLKYFKHINNMHLKSHKLTTKEFKILYPENNTCSEEFSKIRSESNRKQMLEIHNSSSEEYLKLRYKNIGVGRKVAWDNCPPERRKILIDECYKPLIDYNNNPENKAKKYKKIANSLKNYYKNMDPETKMRVIKNSVLKLRKYGGWKIIKYIDCVEYKFRSVPETWIAETLSEYKISFEYETLSIPYIINDETHIYIPDFYLQSYNLIIEFKGYNFFDEVTQNCKEYYTKKLGYEYILLMYKPKEQLILDIKQIINRLSI